MNLTQFLQLGLIVIFAFSGSMKLFSTRSTRDTLNTLGVQSYFSVIGAWVIPIAELIAACALISEYTLLFGELLSLGLIGCFTWAVILAFYKKKSVKCNCFGALMPENLGWSTVSHIALLLAADIYILIDFNSKALMQSSVSDICFAIISWMGILFIYILITTMLKLLNQSNNIQLRR
jgi:hypothetical protein